MGFFGGFLYDGRSWTETDHSGMTAPSGPWLHVDIHDSDFAVLTYRPAGPGTGTAFIGYTPSVYFGEPDASPPTDAPREAAGLAAWWSGLNPSASAADRDTMAATLLPYLATDEPQDDEDDEDDDEFEDEDEDDGTSPFVEDKVDDFLTALGLPSFRTAP
ncbi:hypothetical protein [Dactylosporangium sp. NPDC000521]|uniref:hypothetical protein n=1 Tax=Dactylosporangium sp. NPDC000521 TaxID=3363975 RepID=UPI00369BF8DB